MLALVVVFIIGCDKAPDGIIKESTMVDLMTEMHKMETIIEMHPELFPSDSSKRLIKQSLFKKYDITQAEYDTSLIWYAQNIETYEKVYKKVVKNLQEEQAELAEEMNKGRNLSGRGNERPGSHKMYPASGDTADLWLNDRTYMLTSGLNMGYINFEIAPDKEHKLGDHYSLNMKLLGFDNNFVLVLATEYKDGSISFSSRNAVTTGWINIDLQSDKNRQVRRIYGYINYQMRGGSSIAFIDSVALVRTHLNLNTYPVINTQKFITRDKSQGKPSAPAGPTSIAPAPKPTAPQAGPQRVLSGQERTTERAPKGEKLPLDKPQKLYVPKEGVNKGNHTKGTPPQRK